MVVQISALPTPPTRQDPTNFNDRADTFLSALPTFQTEANALSIEVNNRADNVEASDLAVMAATNITKWVSGTTYAEGAVVWSPINGLGYRRITASGSGTTDPSLDTTNYKQVNGTGDVSTSGNQTISGVKVFNDNLGLGVTPSAWQANWRVFQASRDATFGGTDGGAVYGFMSVNSYADGTASPAAATWRYTMTGSLASKYEQISGTHRWFTAPSGTAGNPITFTQAMTLDASGNLSVGDSTVDGMRMRVAGYSAEIYDPATYSSKSAYVPKGSQEIFEVGTGATAKTGYANLINIAVNDNNGGDSVYLGAVAQSNGNSAANFVFGRRTGVQTWAESARIDSSGNLLVGTTIMPTSTVKGFGIQSLSDGVVLNIGLSTTAAYQVVGFYNPNGSVGNITIVGSTTTYNTSSDYRLKHDIAPMQNALQRVAALKPVTYKWNADGSDGEGFIAHELAEVCPQAVTGEKDAVDADGKPVYQGIDTSFLVATLAAAIQEQQAIITELRSRIEALEAK